MLGFEPSTFVSKIDILTTTPIVHNNYILLKIDIKNAFNTVRRDHIQEIGERRAPSLRARASMAYSSVSELVYGGNLVQSAVRQCDPLGSVRFALTVDEISRSANSPVIIWHLDDSTIGGPSASVHTDLSQVIHAIGFEFNPSKSEITYISNSHSSALNLISSRRFRN